MAGSPPGAVDRIRVFAPASVANLGPGFDVLGVALDGLGDTVELSRDESGAGVRILAITGLAAGIPKDTARNCAGTAAASVLARATGGREVPRGLAMRLHKGLPRGSGLGSSAASAVAGAVAADRLLGTRLDTGALLEAALDGEAVASGARHADNLAASLLGGFTIVKSQDPVEVIRLDAPADLRLVVVLPAMEIETRRARQILPRAVPLEDAVANWANVAALVAAVARGRVADIGRAVIDRIVEPARKHLIPGFDEVKGAALQAGAAGCSISGAGPALFAITVDGTSRAVARAMSDAFARRGVAATAHICAADNRGARVLS